MLKTKHCVSFLNFFVSSMVILSHLLSLLNKPWTPKPRSTLFMGNRFPFSSKLISVSCFTVLHFFNIFGFTINFPHCYFFKYGSTTEHIKLKVTLASVNRSITASLILEQFLQVGYLYFGRLFQNYIIFFIFGQTSTILSATNLFSTHRVAQK